MRIIKRRPIKYFCLIILTLCTQSVFASIMLCDLSVNQEEKVEDKTRVFTSTVTKRDNADNVCEDAYLNAVTKCRKAEYEECTTITETRYGKPGNVKEVGLTKYDLFNYLFDTEDLYPKWRCSMSVRGTRYRTIKPDELTKVYCGKLYECSLKLARHGLVPASDLEKVQQLINANCRSR